MRKIFSSFFISVLFMIPNISKAELVFSAPPRESAEAGEKIYKPIAESLSLLLGEKVIYQHPTNWLSYSSKMRKGKYDLVFDGPQFSSWRMVHIKHAPLVRLKGNLVFYVITKKDSGFNDLHGLIGKKVCGLASPNLATLSMLREYKNPALEPFFIEARGNMKTVFNKLSDGKCVAAVTRSNFFKNKLPTSVSSQYKVIWESKALPNQTITAGEKISVLMKKKITAALTSEKGALAASALFERFSKSSTAFVLPKENEYQGINYLLEGYVRGW